MKKFKGIKMPNTIALLFYMMIAAAILTWIIPAGEYDTEQVNGMNKVIVGTYHQVEATPVGPWGLLMSVAKGFYNSAKLMFTVFMVGGAIGLLEKCGAFTAAFSKLAENKKLNHNVLVFVFMLLMSIAGATAVIANSAVAFLPIGLVLAASLGYDFFTGFLIIYMGAYSGFNVGWANIATIGTAQKIAELPIFSGFGARFVIYVINFLLCYFFTIRYMSSIKKDPTKSLNYSSGMKKEEFMGITALGSTHTENTALTKKHIISLLGLLVAIIALLVGAIKLDWGYDHMTTIFLTLAIFVGIVNGYGPDGTVDAFIEGSKTSVGSAFLIGFATAISVILDQGNILNTIVNWLSIPLSSCGPVLGANFMFIANTIVNFFIGSGSGQAAVVMPLMTPLADLIGITRQVAVQAFQFGDGFSNCFYPMGGVLLACLSIAKVEYPRYIKWFLPLIGLQMVLSVASLTILQLIGWTGI